MAFDLLADGSTTTWIAVAVLCVLIILCVIYGVFRKFNQTSWLGWQLALIFPCTLVLGSARETLAGTEGFAVALGVFLAWTTVVLGGGAAFRYYLLRRARPAHPFFRVMNRILGGLTALVNLLAFVVVWGGVALAVAAQIPSLSESMGAIYELEIMETVGEHAFDLLLVAALALALRGGYRVGFGRSVFAVIMLVLTAGCVLLGLYFPVGVRFSGKGLATLMAGTMKKLPAVTAFFVGYLISAILVFLVSFAMVVVLGALMNYCVRKCRSVPVLGVVDGVILSVVSFVLAAAIWCGLFALTRFIAGGGLDSLLSSLGGGEASGSDGSLLQPVQDVFLMLETLFRSSPFSAILYDCNLISF